MIVSVLALVLSSYVPAQDLPPVDVEGQPLAANVQRLVEAMDHLGVPLAPLGLPEKTAAELKRAVEARDAEKLQKLLDPHVLLVVDINPEARVKARRGPAEAVLQQGGFTPVIVKVINESTVKSTLRISSPQSGPVYTRDSLPKIKGDPGAFLQAEMFTNAPMSGNLSGLKAEYAIALLYSSEAGKREATIGFDVGQGTQDLGFRGETPVLFDVRPAIPVKVFVKDFDGKPTVGRFQFQDALQHIFPLQAKRLAPDFFFQKQIYRADGGTVLLPPGSFRMIYSRGPEYKVLEKEITVPAKGNAEIRVELERWINPVDYGFYSGDHHIHAAGCAHYTNPTEGVKPEDMFLHVKGEGLNVGCNLTWGPCFDYQKGFFEPGVNKVSEPFTVLKYDVEVSGFGSERLGHVCLLNLQEQFYPGSDGLKTKGWPTWTTPLMKWAKKQGAVTGYAHSANGLGVNPNAAAARLRRELDADRNGEITLEEAAGGLMPEDPSVVDANKDGKITEDELFVSLSRVCAKLPNFAVPEMDGIGAQEICVTAAQGLCDFISAMDTSRVCEWNCWYHIMNCGFPLKVSGETDFPCITGSRVGQGRVYVQLGKVDKVDFTAWCDGLAKGRSYVSDGHAHALEFTVEGKRPGGQVDLEKAGSVAVKAKVAFATETPLGTSVGGSVPGGPKRLVEVVVNGAAVASKEAPADGTIHDLDFGGVRIGRSSWVALRHFPQMHTNPVDVIVAGKPIRASRKSALWCVAVIEQLWRVRGKEIAESERDEAKKTFDAAIEQYRKIAAEAAD